MGSTNMIIIVKYSDNNNNNIHQVRPHCGPGSTPSASHTSSVNLATSLGRGTPGLCTDVDAEAEVSGLAQGGRELLSGCDQDLNPDGSFIDRKFLI